MDATLEEEVERVEEEEPFAREETVRAVDELLTTEEALVEEELLATEETAEVAEEEETLIREVSLTTDEVTVAEEEPFATEELAAEILIVVVLMEDGVVLEGLAVMAEEPGADVLALEEVSPGMLPEIDPIVPPAAKEPLGADPPPFPIGIDPIEPPPDGIAPSSVPVLFPLPPALEDPPPIVPLSLTTLPSAVREPAISTVYSALMLMPTLIHISRPSEMSLPRYAQSGNGS